jgi:serine protein kinase
VAGPLVRSHGGFAMDLSAMMRGIQQEARQLSREVSFETYLDMVRRDRRLARLSHELIHDMILAAGTRPGPDGRAQYQLFHDRLFGVDDAISQVVDYFAAAARRLEARKRILLLIGPPGSGKSTLVNTIKEGLEDYTRTAAGAVYAIKGCPVYENPLHLIPRHRRGALRNIHVEGELCPYCGWLVRNVYKHDVTRVPVQRFSFSVSQGIGLGTYVATDPGSEDLSRLVGSVDLSELRGSTDRQAARQAYRLDGELNAGNRGLADLIEILKMDERFLAVLLTLSQEQVVKLSGRGTMYADEAIVAHSNLAEYASLIADPKAAALLDRLVVVRMHYPLAVRDEVHVYTKMIDESGLKETSLSPLALPAAATFAVLTRLSPAPGGWTLARKLHFYDGRFVSGVQPGDLDAVRSGEREDGTFGFSPRYVMNQLSRALSTREGCLSGAAVLDTLWEGLTQRAGFGEADREAATEVFAVASAEYDEMVKRAIRRALVPNYERQAKARARDALRDLEAWSGKGGRSLDALRPLERALDVPYFRRDDLRGELLAQLRAADGEELHRADPRVEEGIERSLLPSWSETASTLNQSGEKRSGARTKLRNTLVGEWGFPEDCANDLIDHATRLAGTDSERRGIFSRLGD